MDNELEHPNPFAQRVPAHLSHIDPSQNDNRELIEKLNKKFAKQKNPQTGSFYDVAGETERLLERLASGKFNLSAKQIREIHQNIKSLSDKPGLLSELLRKQHRLLDRQKKKPGLTRQQVLKRNSSLIEKIIFFFTKLRLKEFFYEGKIKNDVLAFFERFSHQQYFRVSEKIDFILENYYSEEVFSADGRALDYESYNLLRLFSTEVMGQAIYQIHDRGDTSRYNYARLSKKISEMDSYASLLLQLQSHSHYKTKIIEAVRFITSVSENLSNFSELLHVKSPFNSQDWISLESDLLFFFDNTDSQFKSMPKIKAMYSYVLKRNISQSELLALLPPKQPIYKHEKTLIDAAYNLAERRHFQISQELDLMEDQISTHIRFMTEVQWAQTLCQHIITTSNQEMIETYGSYPLELVNKHINIFFDLFEKPLIKRQKIQLEVDAADLTLFPTLQSPQLKKLYFIPLKQTTSNRIKLENPMPFASLQNQLMDSEWEVKSNYREVFQELSKSSGQIAMEYADLFKTEIENLIMNNFPILTFALDDLQLKQRVKSFYYLKPDSQRYGNVAAILKVQDMNNREITLEADSLYAYFMLGKSLLQLIALELNEQKAVSQSILYERTLERQEECQELLALNNFPSQVHRS